MLIWTSTGEQIINWCARLRLRAGLDQESRPIFPLETLKSGSLIGRRIEANLDEFRLGVKAITKYWNSIHKIFVFYSQDLRILFTRYGLLHTLTRPQGLQNGLTKGWTTLRLLGPSWGHVRILIGAELMKETQPQVLESTSQWLQKILAFAPNLNRP
jgi:hypothetical protein